MSKVIEFPHKFTPRDYQIDPLMALFALEMRHFYFIQHRRSGKDKLTLQMVIGYLCKRVGLGFYLFPHAVQARKSIWRGRGDDGARFIDHVPAQLIKKVNDLEMSIELINGSILQLGGSSNIDNLVGSNPIMIAYSEFPLHNPMVRQLLSPILAENKGVEILNGTPRGRGPAYDIFKAALTNPEWYVKHLTVEDTKRADGLPVVSQAEIDSFRQSGMDEAIIQQEFYCNWDSGNVGAFYTQEMQRAEIEKRIGIFEIKKNLPCFVFMDIGIADATAIWILQPDGDRLRMVYYYESTGQGFAHYAQVLAAFKERFGVKIQYHFGPHDLQQRQWGAAPRTALKIAQDCGIHFLIVPNVSIEDGIQSVKALFGRVEFHIEHCSKGIEALTHYRREYDFELRTFKKAPMHDWSSHCADAFRYFAVQWLANFTRPEMNQPRKFHNAFHDAPYGNLQSPGGRLV